MKNLALSLLSAGTFLSVVKACGMIVHMDVTERALTSFKSADDTYPYEDILRRYHSYV